MKMALERHSVLNIKVYIVNPMALGMGFSIPSGKAKLSKFWGVQRPFLKRDLFLNPCGDMPH